MTPDLGPPVDVLKPEAAPVPLVVSSPHSGRIYPPSLLDKVGLGQSHLRRLEDGCVDRLFDSAPELGAPLLRARFARAYVDPNREAFELDPDLFGETLPAHVNVSSIKARAGLGTIPSRLGGCAIYSSRLSFAEAERRIRLAYWPYHEALQHLISQTVATFGGALLLDCHSMPSLTANDQASRDAHVDVALGDRFGRSCAPFIVERAEQLLLRRGFRAARNRPYAGGFITTRYGAPAAGVHALQIEVRRDLYMDERTFTPHVALEALKGVIRELMIDLAALMLDHLADQPPRLARFPFAS
jgi:N-formylglutamate amidohydrolase